jgi:hypothetical protein
MVLRVPSTIPINQRQDVHLQLRLEGDKGAAALLQKIKGARLKEKEKGLDGKWGLCVVPLLRRDAGLPEYFLHQTGTDVTCVGIGNADLLAPFDHKLMFPA